MSTVKAKGQKLRATSLAQSMNGDSASPVASRKFCSIKR